MNSGQSVRPLGLGCVRPVPPVQTAAPDAIACDQPPKLRNFAHDDMGRPDVHALETKFGEDARQQFRLEPKPSGNQGFVVGQRNRTGTVHARA